MNKEKPQQKLISFTDSSAEFDNIAEDMKKGWSIISLIKNGSYYVGIMELKNTSHEKTESLYIPPRKKIKISAGN